MATYPRLINAFFPNWKDVGGKQANCMWSAGDQSDAGLGPYGGLATASQALSCAALFTGITQVRAAIPADPITGPYCTVLDQVVFVVQSAATSMQIAVPAPKEEIFVGSSVNVDLDNSDVVAWWDAVRGVLGDSYGNPWTQLKYGYRRKVGASPR